MDEQYIADLYNQLGGSSKFGTFEDFKSLITTDSSYQKDFHNAFGESVLGSYDDFASLVSVTQQPKKKDGGVFSQPLEAAKELQATVEEAEAKKRGITLAPEGTFLRQTQTSSLASEPINAPLELPSKLEERKYEATKERTPEQMQAEAFEKSIIPSSLYKATKKAGEEVRKKEEEIPKFLKPAIESITPEYLGEGSVYGKDARTIISDLNQQYEGTGFDFSGRLGDKSLIKVKAPNGETMSVNIGWIYSEKEAAEQLRNFIKENSTSIKELNKLEEEYQFGKQKFINKKNVEESTKLFTQEATDFGKRNFEFVKRADELKLAIDELNLVPESQRNTQEFLSKKQYVDNLSNELKVEQESLIEFQERLQSKEINLKKSIGEYTKFKERQGGWAGGIWNSMAKTIASLPAAAYNIGVDIVTEGSSAKYLLGDKEYKKQFLQLARDKYNIDSDSYESLMRNDKLTEQKYNLIINELKDRVKKERKYGEEGEEGMLPYIRRNVYEFLKDKNTSEQWTELKNKSTYGQILLGVTGSLPTMLMPGGAIGRTVSTFLSLADGVFVEMENDPDFKNISENEKWVTAAPLAMVGSALEEVGLSSILKNTNLTKYVTGRILSKGIPDLTPSIIKNLVNDEVRELISNNTLKLVNGFLAEAETGALQTLSDYTIKDIYNYSKESKMFDTPDTAAEWITDVLYSGVVEGAGGMMITAPLVAANAFSRGKFTDMDDVTFTAFTSAYQDINIEKAFVSSLKNKVAAGEMTIADAKTMLNDYRNAKGLLNLLPDNIREEDKRRALDLLNERKKLEKKIDGKDPALVKPTQNRINEINEQLTKLSENAVQEQTAGEVPVQPEAGVVEEVEGGKPETELEVTPEEVTEEGVITEEVTPAEKTPEEIDALLEEIFEGTKPKVKAPEMEVAPEIPTLEEGKEQDIEIVSTETTPEEQIKEADEFKEEELPEAQKPAPGKVEELAVDDIVADPERFQYKETTDKKAGVTDKFKKEKLPFKKELAGVISVWIDPADGKTYVINGHHRLDFAKRSGEKTMNVIYIDAENASEARAKGAMQNIAEGMGTDVDAAKIFRETGMTEQEARDAGIDVKGAKASNGLALANLSDSLFDLVAQGKLSQTIGIIIGSTIDNKNVQEQFYNTIKNKNLTNATIKIMAEDIQSAPVETVEVMDLFGTTATEQAAYEQRASFIASVRGIVSRAKNVLGKTAKSAEFLSEYGNLIDVATTETGSKESAMGLAVFDKLRNTSPEIKELIDKGVERIKNGENKTKVTNETARAIIEATPRVLEGAGGKVVPGRVEAKKPSPKGGKGAKGEKLSDKVRALKIKGPGGLQSNILGVPIEIWNAAMETVATAIDAGNKLADQAKVLRDALAKGYAEIKDKYKNINKEKYEAKVLNAMYSNAIQLARESKISDDSIKAYLTKKGLTESQADALLKIKPKAEKKAPSAEKIVGKPKAKKVTVNEMSALKDQIKFEAKAAREAKGDLNTKRKMLADAINKMVKAGSITAAQAKSLINRVNKVNLDNPVMVERLLDYAEKVFENADYADKLSQANKLRSAIKGLSKNKNKFGDLTAFAAEFAKIDPSMVDSIDEYINIASNVKEGVQGSKIIKDKVMPASAVDIGKTMEYVKKKMEAQEKTNNKRIAERLQELMGVDVSDLTYDQMMELLEQPEEKAINKYKEDVVRGFINKMFNTYSTIINDMFRTGIDPFSDPDNPTIIEFKDSEKNLVKEFMGMDLKLLDVKESLRAADALNNFIANKSIAGMGNVLATYNGIKNAKEVDAKKVRAKQIKMYFSPAVGRLFFDQFASVPLLFERLFKGFKVGQYVREKMGINSLINHKAEALDAANRVINKYVLEFSKMKPNKRGFQDMYNIIERGIIGDLAKTIVGNEQQIRAEFNRRKKLIEESIQILEKGGTKKESEAAKVIKEVYEKIAKDSKTIEEVKAKADKINVDAVQFWVDEWAKLYDEFAEVALSVYNKVLDKNINYVPDRFGFLERADKVQKDADGNESLFFSNSNIENFYKKEAGSLMKSTPPSSLFGKDGKAEMYVNLSFDTNNANALLEALIDIKTAADIRQIQAFKNSPEFDNIFPSGKDASLTKDRIATLIRNIRNKRIVTDKVFRDVTRNLDRISALGTTLALAGPTQVLSQTLPVAVNTFINGGGNLKISAINNKDINNFINNSGMGIANRGIDATTELETLNQKLEAAATGKTETVLRAIENINRQYLKTFLSNFDVLIARASWITYYEQSLKKQNKLPKEGIDYSKHELNKEAAQYAQDMIDRQQNISDKDLAGKMYQSGDPFKQFFIKIVMPLTTFRMNQTTRFSNDLAILSSKTSSNEDKAIAAKSLGGFAAEMATFRMLKLYIGYYIFYGLAQFIRGEEEEEEDKDKKWNNMLRGAATSAAVDVFSPIPLTDTPTKLIINSTLDQLQALADMDQEERYNIFTEMDKTPMESFVNDLGLLGVPIEKSMKLYENIELGVTGKFKKEYFGQETEMNIKEKDRKLLSNPFFIALGIANNFGINPLSPETSNIMNTIVKNIKKDAKTNTQLEKEAAYEGYDTQKEFKEKDPEGFMKAKNNPDSPLNKKKEKDAKERADKYFEEHGEYPEEKKQKEQSREYSDRDVSSKPKKGDRDYSDRD